MNYLQLPDHTYKAKMSGLELLIYADVWTMQQIGKPYWKSNATIAKQFKSRRTSVLRSIAKLESMGYLHRVEKGDSSRFLEALIPDSGSLQTETGLRAETSLQMESGSLQTETGVVSKTHASSLQMETQVENKREEEKKRKERRAKPRDFDEVMRFFDKLGEPELSTRFFNHWEMRGWKIDTARRVQDWMAAARKFIEDEQRFRDERGDIRRAVKREKQRSKGTVDWEDDLRADVAKYWYNESGDEDSTN